MKKIFIVEDDAGIATSLKLYLENSDFEVLVHDSGARAAEMIIQEKPDLVILDVNLPEYDGIQVCEKVRQDSSVPIIMLTARGGEMDRITGLESGADDYIAKPFSPRELLARIQSILRRVGESEGGEESHILTHDTIQINRDTLEVLVSGEEISVTKNEYDILERIFLEKGKLVTRESLMKDVIGYDNYVYDRTIDTHIKNLRKKLGESEVILTVRGKGYRLNN